jgi:transposase InsO family protein
MHHASARLSVHSRATICRRVIEEGWTVTAAATAAAVSRQTASKWVARFKAEGSSGLANRSTRPHRIPRRVPPELVAKIEQLRRERLGPHRIAWTLEVARSTVYAVLRRLGLGRLRALEPRRSVIRYEWPRTGDMIHVDTKKLGRIGSGGGKRFGGAASKPRHRGIGWNVVHLAVDDHSRLAYAEELPDELGETATAFMDRAIAFYEAHGIQVRRVLSDNGSPYRSRAFAELLASRGIKACRTRPYTPRTNGKAEAMVKILINSWAYAVPFRNTDERAASLSGFIDFYNHERPHGGLNGARPIDRVRQ